MMNSSGISMEYGLKPLAARQLSHETITIPMMEELSPKWLLSFLPWVPVTAGVYRVNKRKCCPEGAYPAFYEGQPPAAVGQGCNEYGEKSIEVISCPEGAPQLPQTFPDYEENPREYMLRLIQAELKIPTQVTDIFNNPHDQLEEQMRLSIEVILERQEWELVNNPEFGLINSVAPEMRLSTRTGPPTPDDLDALLARVWKKPAFFLAHPQAIAAFTRECTKRGVPPVTVNLFGSPFITWRGVPLVPTDKLMVNGRSRSDLCCSGKTQILLLRVGEQEQGVVGLHQPGIPDEKYRPSLAVRLSHIDNQAIAHYILSLYFSLAVLTRDALGMLENVEVGVYHGYA